jgi:hypothetical protein
MKKKLVLTAIAVLIVFPVFTTLVLAEGPTNVDGIPYNDNAWWHSGQYIGPEVFGCGTETTIVLDDVTIVVDIIPSAVYDEETGEWTGTHLMWKGRYGNNYPENSWFAYKFWLNGSGPVGITYTYEDGPVVEDYATEFIFFKVRYTDNGWETTLQAYR